MTRVAVLGLGAMGSRMAVRMLEAGHGLTVWNRTATAGADLPSASRTREVFARARAAGLGAADISALGRLFA